MVFLWPCLAISRQLARENYDIQIYSRYLQGILKNILKRGEESFVWEFPL